MVISPSLIHGDQSKVDAIVAFGHTPVRVAAGPWRSSPPKDNLFACLIVYAHRAPPSTHIVRSTWPQAGHRPSVVLCVVMQQTTERPGLHVLRSVHAEPWSVSGDYDRLVVVAVKLAVHEVSSAHLDDVSAVTIHNFAVNVIANRYIADCGTRREGSQQGQSPDTNVAQVHAQPHEHTPTQDLIRFGVA
jgi:hypothetical protein